MPGNIHSPTPKLKEGTFFFRPAFLRILSYPPPPGISHNHDQGVSGGSGEWPGGPTPLLLDQNEARRAGKNFLSWGGGGGGGGG